MRYYEYGMSYHSGDAVESEGTGPLEWEGVRKMEDGSRMYSR